MNILMKASFPVISAMAMVLCAGQPAKADAAGDFLKQLEGNWRGRGQATIPGRKNAERITCQVTNIYEAASSELLVSGECASTQGKTPVKGRLSHTGNTVSGSLIDAYKGATVTKSVGSVSSLSLDVSSNFVDDATGNLTRTRQVVQLSDTGFSADFFTFDTRAQEFKPAGSLTFSAN